MFFEQKMNKKIFYSNFVKNVNRQYKKLPFTFPLLFVSLIKIFSTSFKYPPHLHHHMMVFNGVPIALGDDLAWHASHLVVLTEVLITG